MSGRGSSRGTYVVYGRRNAVRAEDVLRARVDRTGEFARTPDTTRVHPLPPHHAYVGVAVRYRDVEKVTVLAERRPSLVQLSGWQILEDSPRHGVGVSGRGAILRQHRGAASHQSVQDGHDTSRAVVLFRRWEMFFPLFCLFFLGLLLGKQQTRCEKGL